MAPSSVGLLLAIAGCSLPPASSPPTCPQFSESTWVRKRSHKSLHCQSDEGPTWFRNQAPDQKAPKASSVMKTLATPLALRYTYMSLSIFSCWQNFISNFMNLGFGLDLSYVKFSLSKIKTCQNVPSFPQLPRIEKYIGNIFRFM